MCKDSGISVDRPSGFCSLYLTSSALSSTASRERCSWTGAVGGFTLWKNWVCAAGALHNPLFGRKMVSVTGNGLINQEAQQNEACQMCEEFFQFPFALQNKKGICPWTRRQNNFLGDFFSSLWTAKCFLLPTSKLLDLLLKNYGEKRKLLLQIMFLHVLKIFSASFFLAERFLYGWK